MIAKDKIKLETNPFHFTTKNVANEKMSDDKEKPKGGRKPAAEKHEGDLYRVKYLERIIELCKINGVSHLTMPSGLVLNLNVLPIEASLKARKVHRKKSTPQTRARAQHAREVYKAMKEAKLKEAEAAQDQSSDEDILFWSSSPGGVPV